jgi:hypothetical protein
MRLEKQQVITLLAYLSEVKVARPEMKNLETQEKESSEWKEKETPRLEEQEATGLEEEGEET